MWAKGGGGACAGNQGRVSAGDPGGGCGCGGSRADEPAGANGDVEWEVVLRAGNYALAGMIKELLEGEGFLVMLRSESGLPHAAFGGPLDVLVPSDQVGAARALVDAFAETGSEEPPPEGGES